MAHLLRRQTYRESFHGQPPSADILIGQWNDALIAQLLEYVWTAYDDLHETIWSKIDWTKSYDDLERNLSEDVARVISERIDGYLPVSVMHGPFERESRSNPPAQPPQYDIAFQWMSDPRLMWPVEAKVIASDQDTGENLDGYLKEGCGRFFNCYYAPFSSGGAMLAYLKSGSGQVLAGHISRRLNVTFSPYRNHPVRSHFTSNHMRVVPVDKDYPCSFTLHHIIFSLFSTD